MLLAASILVARALAGHWRLRRFRYGPLEWCPRCLTWWRAVPNRRAAVH